MTYDTETIKASQQIFYYLLENHEMREDHEPQLYKAYTESEEVQDLVKSQGEIALCSVERYGNVVYLIPEEENRFLGFSKLQLKKKLCRSNAADKDYYLAQFAVLTLLLEFYDGQGSSSKTRDYIRVGDLQNSIADRLKEGAGRLGEEAQAESGFAFTEMLQSYEALRSDENGRRQKTTKEGFLYTILKFLQEQGLIEYVEQDEMIKTTNKMDHFMDYNLLNKANYNRVLAVLEVNQSGED